MKSHKPFFKPENSDCCDSDPETTIMEPCIQIKKANRLVEPLLQEMEDWKNGILAYKCFDCGSAVTPIANINYRTEVKRLTEENQKLRDINPVFVKMLEENYLLLTAHNRELGISLNNLAHIEKENERLRVKVSKLAQLLAPAGQGEAVRVIDDIVSENERLRAENDKLRSAQLRIEEIKK